jgi:hypothetical protein
VWLCDIHDLEKDKKEEDTLDKKRKEIGDVIEERIQAIGGIYLGGEPIIYRQRGGNQGAITLILGQGTEGLGGLEKCGDTVEMPDVRIGFDGVGIVEMEGVVPMIGIGNEDHRKGKDAKRKQKEILFFVHKIILLGAKIENLGFYRFAS